MPVSAYPSLTTTIPAHFEELEPDFAGVVTSPEFGDGAHDFNIAPAAARIRRFLLRYTGKTQSEALVIINHAIEAKYSRDKGSALSFGFTTKSGEVLSGVRYERGGLRYEHSKAYIYSLEVILIDRP